MVLSCQAQTQVHCSLLCCLWRVSVSLPGSPGEKLIFSLHSLSLFLHSIIGGTGGLLPGFRGRSGEKGEREERENIDFQPCPCLLLSPEFSIPISCFLLHFHYSLLPSFSNNEGRFYEISANPPR